MPESPIPASPFLAITMLILGLAGCGSEFVTAPAEAGTCAELVESGRAVAENVLERLSGQTLEELEAANPGDPFAAVDHLLRTAEFEDQAEVLGCQPEELQLQACEIYGGLAYRARGQVARNFLDPYLQSCD